ncbi:MAG: heme ABC exporter ATP-binding protein CcmA [Rhodospirillaceae bacterium]|nr:heme ABC exporter ATP-binding protein CcmA [Rhodospirillaceae bacterium]
MTEPKSSALFRAEGLACRRGERPVFAGIFFELAEGAGLLLTGANGSGKSSLLRLLAGLLPAESGTLYWSNAPVAADRDAQRARILFLGHRDAVKSGLTVLENIEGWASLQRAPSDAGRTALAAFDLERLADLPARYLSAGQRRRLALARLLLVKRPLWLLDEPQTGLDEAATERLATTIENHRAGGGIAVVATHGGLDLPGAERLDLDVAHRAALDAMRAGELR